MIILGFGFRNSGLTSLLYFEIQVGCFGFSDFGFRVSGFGFRVSGFRFRVSGFGFQISGLEFGFGVEVLRFRVEGHFKPLTLNPQP